MEKQAPCNVASSKVKSIAEFGVKSFLSARYGEGKQVEAKQSQCRLAGRVQALVEVTIRCILLPLSLVFMVWTIIKSKINNFKTSLKKPVTLENNPSEQLTILVSGGKMAKSLLVARCLWRLGHKVVLVATSKYWCSGSRFSRAVWKFETVSDKSYVEDMISLIKKHNVDIFIPAQSPAIVIQDAEIKRLVEMDPKIKCRCPFFDVDMINLTDDKHTFGTHCVENGIPSPRTWKVCSLDDVLVLNQKLKDEETFSGRRFLLKNLSYDPIHRLDMFSLPQDEGVVKAYVDKVARDGNAITDNQPWQVQQFVNGKEYSACCVVRKGLLLTLTVSESSPSQIDYVESTHSIVNDAIKKSVTDLVTETFPSSTDGIFCLDFIVEFGEDGSSAIPYVIECNPRIHSQMVVYCQNTKTMRELGKALVSLEPTPSDTRNLSVRSMVGEECQLYSYYWLYNELFKVISPWYYGSSSLKQVWNMVVSDSNSVEADLDPEDPLPFVMRNHFQMPVLLLGVALSGKQWKKCDINIGKVVEVGGD